MTTTQEERRSSGSGKKRRTSDDAGAAPPSPPSHSRKRAAASSSDVRIKVARPAKSSATAPAALAPFVGYLAHGRLGAAAQAARTIDGGGGKGAAGGAEDPDGAKAASKVKFDVYEAPRGRAPVYVAELAGPSAQQQQQQQQHQDAGAASSPPPELLPRLLLVGRTDGQEQAGAAAAGWYAVGVYSRSKGTLTLARAQDGRLARVEPVLPAAAAAAAAAAQRAAPDAAAGDAREQSRRLVDAFGSTRRKRQLAAREEGAVRSDRLLEGGAGVQAALARVNAAAARDGGTRDAVLARAAASRNVPPHDPAATTPGRAYRVRSFFPAGFWDALSAGQLLAAAEDPAQMAKLRERRLVPEYVLSRCDALLRPAAAAAGAGGGKAEAPSQGSPAAAASRNTEEGRRARARLLAAVAALLALHAARGSVRVPVGPGGYEEAARKLRICARGEALEALLGLFYVQSGRAEGDDEAAAVAAAAAAGVKAEEAAAVKAEEGGGGEAAAAGEAGATATTAAPAAARPPRAPRPAADVYVRDDRQKGLALAYALVVALEAEGWRMSPEAFEALRAELRVGPRDLVARFRELGCDCAAASVAGGGEGGGSVASYSVSLLQQKLSAAGGGAGAAAAPPSPPPRTLEDAFPKAKRPAAKRR